MIEIPSPTLYSPCPACNNNTWSFYKKARNRITGRDEDLIKCAGCGLIRNRSFPDKNQEVGIFRPSYFNSKKVLDEIDYRANIVPHIERFGGGRKILDIGCGCGNLLAMLRESGYDAQGLEIASEAANHALQAGLSVERVSLFEYKPAGKLFDVAVMDNVIEHLEAPDKALRKIQGLLAPGGLVILRVPNEICFARYILGLFGSRGCGIYYQPFEHIYHFTEKSLVETVQNSDFEVLFSTSRLSLFGIVWRFGLMFNTLGQKKMVARILRLLLFLNPSLPFPWGNLVTVVARAPTKSPAI